jgi:aldose 1-epimerase
LPALQRILLRQDPITVGISPSFGGSLTRFDVRVGSSVVDILRPADDRIAAQKYPLGASSFPLLPYGGRLREGQYSLRGRTIQYPLNAFPERHSSHGDAWTSAWKLEHLDRHTALMSLQTGTDAPIQYHCTQRLSVTGNAVHISFRVTNLEREPIPMGIGLHPYFAHRSLAVIKATLPTYCRWDHEMMPLSSGPNPYAEQFLDGKSAAQCPMATEFSDWDGTVDITWPSLRLALSLRTTPPMRHVVLWVPDGADFFCFEPMSHATDALNGRAGHLPAEHFVLLAPGETTEQHFDFQVTTL